MPRRVFLQPKDLVRHSRRHTAYAGNGPIFVEASTYRYHGHSMSDPGISYRSRDDVTSVRRERDCIDQLKKRILEQEWATPAELKAYDKATLGSRLLNLLIVFPFPYAMLPVGVPS